MSDRPRVPAAGRIVGWIVVVVALAYGARLVWELLRPLVPLLVAIVVMGVVYFFITRGWSR
ncbi:hypothetical protein [Glycomyces salinus]|uniref:hypothetical protein n=1 Tax=Glycomyces salinus TaxID=980294 RepID=UPI0018EAF4DE|nr:hypothetical protein [Glycomyces salinus]